MSLFLKAELRGWCMRWGVAAQRRRAGVLLWAAWPEVLILPTGPGPLSPQRSVVCRSEVCALQGSPCASYL